MLGFPFWFSRVDEKLHLSRLAEGGEERNALGNLVVNENAENAVESRHCDFFDIHLKKFWPVASLRSALTGYGDACRGPREPALTGKRFTLLFSVGRDGEPRLSETISEKEKPGEGMQNLSGLPVLL
jgi:hypothetical protein